MEKNKVITAMQEYLDAYHKAWPLSMAIMVCHKGEIIYKGAYGMSDVEHQIPNTVTSKFRIASVTKPFTATAIMILHERGLINFQDPLVKYIPELPQFDGITIHHLLTHTSGIFNFTNLSGFNKTTEKLYYTDEELLGLFKDKPLVFNPGEGWDYCNSGYFLLGMIIERVTGMPFTTFVQENILKPLKMEDTDFDNERRLLPGRVRGYVLNGANLMNEAFVEMSKFHACGGLYSTLDDLFKFDQALYTEQLLSQESIDLMYHPHTNHYGYGWGLDEKFGRKRVGHNGGLGGFVSQLFRYPEDQILVVALGNYIFQNIWQICDDLVAILLGENYNLPQRPKPITLASEEYDKYVGVYKSDYSDFRITVTREGEKIFFRFDDDDKFEVYPIGEETFNHIWIDERYTFEKNEQAEMSVWGCSKV